LGGIKVQGVLFSLIAGIFISLQSVFNARLSEKVGLWQTNIVVHGIGFLTSVILFLIIREENTSKWYDIEKVYLLGGVFGAIVVFSVMQGVTKLGPTYAILILLFAQLFSAIIIESMGLFGTPKTSISINNIIGIIVMVTGIMIFKIK